MNDLSKRLWILILSLTLVVSQLLPTGMIAATLASPEGTEIEEVEENKDLNTEVLEEEVEEQEQEKAEETAPEDAESKVLVKAESTASEGESTDSQDEVKREVVYTTNYYVQTVDSSEYSPSYELLYTKISGTSFYSQQYLYELMNLNGSNRKAIYNGQTKTTDTYTRDYYYLRGRNRERYGTMYVDEEGNTISSSTSGIGIMMTYGESIPVQNTASGYEMVKGYKPGYMLVVGPDGWEHNGEKVAIGDTFRATMPAGDVTFYRVYIQQPYTVELYYENSDGSYDSTPDKTQNMDAGATFDESSGEKTGFVFDRSDVSYTDTDYVEKYYYKRATYTVTYKPYLKDGSWPDGAYNYGNTKPAEYKYGDAVTLPAVGDSMGNYEWTKVTDVPYYDFAWVDEDGNVIEEPFDMPAENITVYGRYTRDDTENPEYITKVYLDKPIWDPSHREYVINSNYELYKTYTDSGRLMTREDIDGEVPSEFRCYDYVYTGEYYVEYYYVYKDWTTVQYRLGGAVPNYVREPSSVEVPVGLDISEMSGREYKDIFDPEMPEPEGYHFLGWETAPTGTITSEGIGLTGVYEKKFKVDIELEGVPEGTENPDPQYYRDGDTLRLEAPKIDGYDFVGWKLEDGSELPERMPNKNITAIAVYRRNAEKIYTTYFCVQAVEGDGYEVTKTVTSKTGFEDADTFSSEGIYYVKTEDVNELKRIHYYDRKTYTVNYKVVWPGEGYLEDDWPVDDIPDLPSQEYRYGATVTFPAMPHVLLGKKYISNYGVGVLYYRFHGWYYDEYPEFDASDPGWCAQDSITMPDSDIIVTGYYRGGNPPAGEDNMREVKIYLETGVGTGEYEYECSDGYLGTGANYGFSEEYYKTCGRFPGYEYSHYEDGEKGSRIVYFNAITDYPEHTVTYVLKNAPEGVSAPAAETHKEGDTVTLASAPSVDGYVFLGWDKAQTFVMPNGDVVVTGTYLGDKKIVIDAEGWTGTYDGDSHKPTVTVDVTDGTTIEYSTDGGQTWTTEVPSITDAGEVEVTVRATNDEYGTSTTVVTLKVNPAELRVTTPSATKVYDGTALRAAATATSLVGLKNGETATVTATGSQTAVGRSTNTYTLAWGTAKPGNYTIVAENLGTLIVTAAAGNGGGNGGGVAGGGAPAGDGGTTVADVTDDPAPTAAPAAPAATINDPATPLSGNGDGAWALINLICSILTALGALVAIFRRKEEEDEDEEANMYRAEEEDEDDNRAKKMFAAKAAGVLTAIASVITFILTEDMTLPMIMIDKWTLLMVIMLAVQVVTAALNKKASKLDDDEKEAEASAN